MSTWTAEGAGLGSTEYRADIDGRGVVVSFIGDLGDEWSGFWDAYLEADSTPFAEGRQRFAFLATEREVQQALATIGTQLAAVLGGVPTETYDRSRGLAVTGDDLTGGQLYVLESGDDWDVVKVSDEGMNTFHLVEGGDFAGGQVRWTAQGWIDAAGNGVQLYAL